MIDNCIVEGKGDEALLIIPGVSGGAGTNPIFNALSNSFEGLVVRLNLWSCPSELNKLCIEEILLVIEKIIGELSKQGVTKLFVVGKSFGGGIALMLQSNIIAGVVLWAPAIGIDTKENIEDIKRKPLGEITSFNDIKLSLNKLPIHPCLILHAIDDTIAQIESSRVLARNENITLKEFPSGDHSFVGCEDEIVKETIRFFTELRKQ